MGGQQNSNDQRGEYQELFAELAGEMRGVRVRLNGILARARTLERENQELRERVQEAEEELSFVTLERDTLSAELERHRQQCEACQSSHLER